MLRRLTSIVVFLMIPPALLRCAGPGPTLEPATSGILTGVPCELPCWQGVSPGDKTTAEELATILEDLPNVRDSVWGKDADSTVVNWIWKQWPWDGTGHNNFTLIDGILTSTFLSVDFEVRAEDIISKYGLPTATSYGLFRGVADEYVRVTMYYPERGMTVALRIAPDNPFLESTSQVIDITLTEPADSMRDWLGPNAMDNADLTLWPGYGELKLSDTR